MERRQDTTESAKAGWEHIIHGFTKIGSSAKFDPAKGMGKHLVRRALDQGIKIAELGGPGGRIGISPPLTITLAEATQAIDRLKPIFADIGKLAA